MVQGLLAKGPVRDVVWVEARAREEAEWAVRLQQGRAVIASVRNAEQQLLIPQDSLVMQKVVQSVERK
ncbi:MAG TPA: hypothetical protein HPP87_00825 [Planctomycetes bacterium]|nr:hypothetical protein [Planctomycetota bacterium]